MSNSQRHRIVTTASGQRQVETSMVSYNNGIFGGGTTVIGGMLGNASTYQSMLDGILLEDESILQAMYEDIYDFDVSCGTTVDLRATLVSSGFTLSGVKDKHLDLFQRQLNRLGFPNIMPQIYLDKYVRGKFISTLLYNRQKKEFSDQMVHSAGDCTIIDSPLYSGKPIIKFQPPESMIEFFTDESEHAKSVRDRMNPEMVRLLSSRGLVDLDDILTLYVPRPSVSGQSRGTSMFRRVVPIYLLEKLLYRGTVSEAQRRQRAILHITAGDETWTPIDAELQALVGMFQQADLDPVGAVLATRNSINVSDVRQGGDFWKWTDVIDGTSQYKLRAMGVSESFLSGESTYSSMEVSLSVFLENLRSDREYVTEAVFNNHLFPLIAHVNDLVHTRREIATGFSHDYKQPNTGAGKSRGNLTGNIAFDITDPTKYITPKLNWDKSLRPEADTEYLQTLDTLVEKGIPIPMSMYASASGISIDEILNHQEKEVEMLGKIKKYKEAIDAIGGEDMMDSEGELDMEMANKRSRLVAKLNKLETDFRSKPRSILGRGIEEETSEIYQGKKHHVPSARANRERTKQKDVAKKVIKTLATDDERWNKSRAYARGFISKNR